MKKYSIKNVIENHCSIEYKKLSICYIPDYYFGFKKREVYQVHVEHHKLEDRYFSMVYEDVDDAVDKFLELKGQLYGA